MPSETNGLQFLWTQPSITLGEGQRPLNFPIIPRSEIFKVDLQVRSAGSSTEGISTFLTNLCEGPPFLFPREATRRWKASNSGGRGGGRTPLASIREKTQNSRARKRKQTGNTCRNGPAELSSGSHRRVTQNREDQDTTECLIKLARRRTKIHHSKENHLQAIWCSPDVGNSHKTGPLVTKSYQRPPKTRRASTRSSLQR